VDKGDDGDAEPLVSAVVARNEPKDCPAVLCNGVPVKYKTDVEVLVEIMDRMAQQNNLILDDRNSSEASS